MARSYLLVIGVESNEESIGKSETKVKAMRSLHQIGSGESS